MPSNGIVVSDTSPLLNLALIKRLDLLRTQFSDVTVPRRVWDELTEGEEGLEELRELRDDNFFNIVEVEQSDLFVEVFHELDLGETAAICYAVEHDAALVLLDEQDGRRVARRHDLDVTGVVGILLRGAKDGEVDPEHELDAARPGSGFLTNSTHTLSRKRESSCFLSSGWLSSPRFTSTEPANKFSRGSVSGVHFA